MKKHASPCIGSTLLLQASGQSATHAGALVRWNGAFHRVADPLRHFGAGLGSLPNPVGSPIDKALVGLFRLKSLLKSEDVIFRSPETTTYSRLKVRGSITWLLNACEKALDGRQSAMLGT